MNVWPLRQVVCIDLDHRADQDDLQGRTCVCQLRDQVAIEAFVNDAVVTGARVGNVLLRDMRLATVQCLLKMAHIYAAWKAKYLRIAVALGAKQALPASKNEVGPPQQGTLPLQQLFGRIFKAGQLVHAIVDHESRMQLWQQRQRHRRVEPHDRIDQRRHQRTQQLLQVRQLVVMKPRHANRGVWHADGHVGRRCRLL